MLFGMSRVFQVFTESEGLKVHVSTEVDDAFLYLDGRHSD